MRFGRNKIALVFLYVLLAMSLPKISAAESSIELSGNLALGSDLLFRGVSQTLGGPGLQGSIDVSSNDNWYAYVWGSNVDFVPDYDPDDGARVEIDASLGYWTEISDRWSADLRFVRYFFPGTERGFDYDYNELIGSLWLDEQYAVTVGFSDSVFGSGENGIFYGLSSSHELSASLSLMLEVGAYDLSKAYDSEYQFAGLNISREFGQLSATLSYYDTFGDPDYAYYSEATGSRVSLQVDFSFPGL